MVRWLSLAASLAGIALVGCGGDDSGSAPSGGAGTMENGQAGTPSVIGSGGSASNGGSSGSQNGASGSENAGASGAPGAGGSSGGQLGADAAVDARSGAGGSAGGPDAGAREAATASCASSDPLKTGNSGRDAFDCTLIDLAAKYQHPDPMMLKAQVNQESDFDEFAVSMDSPCGIHAGWTDAESK